MVRRNSRVHSQIPGLEAVPGPFLLEDCGAARIQRVFSDHLGLLPGRPDWRLHSRAEVAYKLGLVWGFHRGLPHFRRLAIPEETNPLVGRGGKVNRIPA